MFESMGKFRLKSERFSQLRTLWVQLEKKCFNSPREVLLRVSYREKRDLSYDELARQTQKTSRRDPSSSFKLLEGSLLVVF